MSNLTTILLVLVVIGCAVLSLAHAGEVHVHESPERSRRRVPTEAVGAWEPCWQSMGPSNPHPCGPIKATKRAARVLQRQCKVIVSRKKRLVVAGPNPCPDPCHPKDKAVLTRRDARKIVHCLQRRR